MAKNVCQEGGAAMRCMTVLNYPDQCMGGRVRGSFRSTGGWGTHQCNKRDTNSYN